MLSQVATLVGAIVCLQVPPPTASNDASLALQAEFQAVLDRESSALSALAKRLVAEGKSAEADGVRDRIEPEPPRDGPVRFEPLPEFVPSPSKGLANRPVEPDEARSIRSASAKALFELASKAAARGVDRFALADECLRAVLKRDPNHREARRLLGYVEYDGGWATPFAADLLAKGQVLHPKFGWVSEEWVPHLDRGELPGTRFIRGKPTDWLPAEQADALRSSFKRPWQITTEHFEIRTNAPLSESIAFGRRLEVLHDVFFSLFADAIGRENLPLAQRFDHPSLKPVPPRTRHQVWYFADKSQYVAFFRDQLHQDESLSLGFYMPPREARARKIPARSYFYRDNQSPIDAEATLYHEASHQLLFESAGTARYDQNPADFWVWEGLGTYFETLVPQPDGSIQIGGLVGRRIDEAFRRIVENGNYVPISDLVALNRDRYLNGDHGNAVYLHYPESMALVIFLMHHDSGKYRERFLDYVRDAYEGRIGGGRSLESHLAVPYRTLDAEFLAFLKAADARRDR